MAKAAVPGQRLQVVLRDQRKLDVHVGGAEQGPALLFHHGTPSCGRSVGLIDAACRQHGFRLLNITRPGFGSSSRHPGRRVADAVSDGAEVLDQLDVTRAVVAGWSGGAPVALAFGALLAERTGAILLIAGSAPYPAEGLHWFEGLDEGSVAEYRAALAGEDALRTELALRLRFMQSITGAGLLAAPAPWRGPADVAALATLATDMATNFRAALASGVDGWVDDGLSLVRPWGFSLEEVRVPLSLWHGTEDRLAPPAHSHWLAGRIPQARLHIEPDEGHVSIVVNHLDRMLDELRTIGT